MQDLAKSSIDTYVSTAENVSHHSFADTFINIVPTNIFDSLSKGDMLPVIFFAVMFGLGAAAIGEKGKPVIQFAQGTADAMFWVTNQIMKTAPFGVFALIGVTVSKFGLSSRTAANVLGNSLAVVVVSKLEGKYNSIKAQKYIESIKKIA